MLKEIGFKEIGAMRARIRTAVLLTQHRRIKHKASKRAFRVYDDMG